MGNIIMLMDKLFTSITGLEPTIINYNITLSKIAIGLLILLLILLIAQNIILDAAIKYRSKIRMCKGPEISKEASKN